MKKLLIISFVFLFALSPLMLSPKSVGAIEKTDLTLEAVTFQVGEEYKIGEELTVEVGSDITISGGAGAYDVGSGGSFHTLITFRDVAEEDESKWIKIYQKFDPLEADKGSSFDKWTWTPTETGVYIFTLMVDAKEEIDERNEDNNNLTKTITVIEPGTLEMEVTNNVNFVKISKDQFAIRWETNGKYDCTIIYSTKDENLDDDFITPERDVDDYIFGSNFPFTNYSEVYFYELNIKNQGAFTKYFEGTKSYYQIICYNGDGDKKTSPVYSTTRVDPNPPVEVVPVEVIPEEIVPVEAVPEEVIPEETSDTSNTNSLILRLQRKITQIERQVIDLEKKLTRLDYKFSEKYAGTMFLDVENKGRLWYVDPESKKRFYMENGKSALSIGSKLAIGISYEDIEKIPIGIPAKLYNLKDSDGDGLPDRLESAIGSNKNSSDSDGDGYDDKTEIMNSYSPTEQKKYIYNQGLIQRLEGRMLLQVSGPNSHGEIWYIHQGKRWYGGTEDSMYEIMKARSLGAKAEDIRKIDVGEVSGE